MVKTAVVIGRFQPIHNGHWKAVLKAAAKNERLIFVVGSAQYRRTRDNPLSGTERKHMIMEAIRGSPLEGRTSIFLLRDEHDNDRWTAKMRLLLGRPRGITVYSNNPLVRDLLRKIYDVEPLVSNLVLDSTRVRRVMRSDGNWKELVPPAVARFLRRHRLDEVIALT